MSEVEELIAYLETQKTTPTVDRLVSKVKEQDQEIERLQENRDRWRKRYGELSDILCRTTPPNQEWEGPKPTLENLIARVAEQDREIERLKEKGK